MSWLFSQALVEEYSDRISWDGAQSAQLNVMPTPHKFWRNDKTMEFSNLSRFGLTLQLLTENHGMELLTSYLAAFHARTFHPQERVRESMENVQDYGQKWHELLVKFDLITCSWKTHQCLFPEDLPESSVTLPKWGMTRTGHVFQHLTLERPIREIDYGLLPDGIRFFHTPTCTGLDGGSNSRKALKKRNIQSTTNIPLGRSGALNPDWVEWLMGWPIGWTDLKPLEMDRFQKWREAHLNS